MEPYIQDEVFDKLVLYCGILIVFLPVSYIIVETIYYFIGHLKIGTGKFKRRRIGFYYWVVEKKLSDKGFDIHTIDSAKQLEGVARRHKIESPLDIFRSALIGQYGIWFGQESKHSTHWIKYENVRKWAILPGEIQIIGIKFQVPYFHRAANFYEVSIKLDGQDLGVVNFLKERIKLKPQSTRLFES